MHFELDIHPLALENILHTHSKGTTSKADYYLQHLFLRLICLELRDENIVLQPSETQRSVSTEDEDLDSEDFKIDNDQIAALQVEVLKQVCCFELQFTSFLRILTWCFRILTEGPRQGRRISYLYSAFPWRYVTYQCSCVGFLLIALHRNDSLYSSCY